MRPTSGWSSWAIALLAMVLLGAGAVVATARADLVVEVDGPPVTTTVTLPVSFELSAGEEGGFAPLTEFVPAKGVRPERRATGTVVFSFGVLLSPFSSTDLPSPTVPAGTLVRSCSGATFSSCTPGPKFRTTVPAVVSMPCLGPLPFSSGRCSGEVPVVAVEAGAVGNVRGPGAVTTAAVRFPDGASERMSVSFESSPNGGDDGGPAVRGADRDAAVARLVELVRRGLPREVLVAGHVISRRDASPAGERIAVTVYTAERAGVVEAAFPTSGPPPAVGASC